MKHKVDPEVLKEMREKGFIEWLKEDASDWGEYPTDVEPPESDDSEEAIKRYVEDVKERSKEIHQELIDKGEDEFEADFDTPKWPLEDDAPIEAIREYLKYLEENSEAISEGRIID